MLHWFDLIPIASPASLAETLATIPVFAFGFVARDYQIGSSERMTKGTMYLFAVINAFRLSIFSLAR
jgi:hypothetical protein